MRNVQDYYQTARENEVVFRNVLRDLRARKVMYVPEDLKTEANLDEIFQRYSKGQRMGKFTITSFLRPERSRATIGFCDVAPFSGGGAELEYMVKEDDSVQFKKPTSVFRS